MSLGVLIKEMGDGLMAASPSARRAVTAGREIQAEMRRLHRGGSGGIGSWMDPVSGVAAVYHELATVEVDGIPASWAMDRFEDVITAAVLD